MTQVTIKDIARELRVSASTVSRALKDHPGISVDTKKAVNELAKKLDYQPNTIALGLRKRKTFTIGVVIPEIVHFFFSTVISGIEDIAFKNGYNVILCQSNETLEREIRNVGTLLSHRVDGLLVSPSRETHNFDHLQKILEAGIPIVFFDRAYKEMHISSVTVDDLGGGFQATEHLIEMGCQKVAHIAGPQGLPISEQRFEGYKKALDKHHITFDPDMVEVCDKGDIKKGQWITEVWLSRPNPPDGIFASNDMAAVGAMAAIKSRGLRIPRDIAVVGFSDWLMSAWIEPTLSTVSQPGFEMGQIAAQMFLDQIDQPKDSFEPKSKVLKTQLIVRESSNRVASG